MLGVELLGLIKLTGGPVREFVHRRWVWPASLLLIGTDWVGPAEGRGHGSWPAGLPPG